MISHWPYDVKVIAETDKALLCDFYLIEEKLWMPRSQVFEGYKIGKGYTGEIYITLWIEKQKGLRG